MPRTRRRAALGLAAALLLPGLLAGCTGTSAATANGASAYEFDRPAQGPDGLVAVADRRPAPTLSGTTVDGAPLDTASLRGQVVVLNFWASWCGPCVYEARALAAVATATQPDGVAFVGVNLKDERGKAQAFERVQGVPYPSLYDQPGALLLRFRRVVPQQPPTTMLIDRQGRLAGIFTTALTESELTGPVRALAAET